MGSRQFAPKPAEVVACAVNGCRSRGEALRALDATGGQTRIPPLGWGEVDAHMGDGTIVTLFVCSAACERRLARGFAAPRIGDLG